MVMIAFFGLNFGVQLLQAHQVAYLLDAEWNSLLAASVVSLVGFLSLPMKPVLGIASDRLGRETIYTLGAGCLMLAVMLLTLLDDQVGWHAALYLYAVLLAIAYSTVAPVYPSVVADLFGRADYGAIYGMLGVGASLGSAMGVYGGGLIYDRASSYTPGFTVAIVLALMATGAIWIAAPSKARIGLREAGLQRGQPFRSASVDK
jgi:MFS family permease